MGPSVFGQNAKVSTEFPPGIHHDNYATPSGVCTKGVKSCGTPRFKQSIIPVYLPQIAGENRGQDKEKPNKGYKCPLFGLE